MVRKYITRVMYMFNRWDIQLNIKCPLMYCSLLLALSLSLSLSLTRKSYIIIELIANKILTTFTHSVRNLLLTYNNRFITFSLKKNSGNP